MTRFPDEPTAGGYRAELEGNEIAYQQVKEYIERHVALTGMTPEEFKNHQWAKEIEGFTWGGDKAQQDVGGYGEDRWKANKDHSLYKHPVHIQEDPEFETQPHIRNRLSNFLYEEFTEAFRNGQELDALRYFEEQASRALVRLLLVWDNGYEMLKDISPEGANLPDREELENFVREGGLNHYKVANRLYTEVKHSQMAVRRLLYEYSIKVRQARQNEQRNGGAVDDTLLPDDLMLDDTVDAFLAGQSIAKASIAHGIPADGFRRRVSQKIRANQEGTN